MEDVLGVVACHLQPLIWRAFPLQAGPSTAMNWYNVPGNSTKPAGPRGTDTDAVNGNAVMYDAAAGKIFTCGGATCYSGTVWSAPRQPCAQLKTAAPDFHPGLEPWPRAYSTPGVPPCGDDIPAFAPDVFRTSLSSRPVIQASAPCIATRNANLITIGAYGVNATVQPLPPMNYQRAFHNSVVLPDGKVLIMGGQVLAHYESRYPGSPSWPYAACPISTSASKLRICVKLVEF